MTKDQPPKKMF